MTSKNKTAIISKNKISATAIILLLIASMAGALVFVPSASAAQRIPYRCHFALLLRVLQCG